MRIDLNAKTPELPENQSSSQTGSAKRLSSAGINLPADEATLATHTRVQELQSQMQRCRKIDTPGWKHWREPSGMGNTT
jgi:hypothetical protein